MDIKAKAELRRKKILANAEARLKLITHGQKLEEKNGINRVGSGEILNHLTINDSSPISQCSELDDQWSPCNSENVFSPEILSSRRGETSNDDIDIDSSNTDPFDPLQLSFISKDRRLLDLVCFLFLGVLTRLTFLFGFSWMFLENVLVSFLVACLPRLILYPTNNSKTLSGIFSLILLFGAPPTTVHFFVSLVTSLRITFQLFSLFMFSFFLTDLFVISFCTT